MPWQCRTGRGGDALRTIWKDDTEHAREEKGGEEGTAGVGQLVQGSTACASGRAAGAALGTGKEERCTEGVLSPGASSLNKVVLP